jgi:hypothetical protein
VTARLTDSGLLVSLDDAVPEKIVSINRLLPMRTRDDFIPMIALSLRRKQDKCTRDLAKFVDDNQQKKSQVTPGAAKELNSRSAVRFCPSPYFPSFFSALQRITIRLAIQKDRLRL